jgi:hypothetical protein
LIANDEPVKAIERRVQEAVAAIFQRRPVPQRVLKDEGNPDHAEPAQ